MPRAIRDYVTRLVGDDRNALMSELQQFGEPQDPDVQVGGLVHGLLTMIDQLTAARSSSSGSVELFGEDETVTADDGRDVVWHAATIKEYWAKLLATDDKSEILGIVHVLRNSERRIGWLRRRLSASSPSRSSSGERFGEDETRWEVWSGEMQLSSGHDSLLVAESALAWYSKRQPSPVLVRAVTTRTIEPASRLVEPSPSKDVKNG
jgi:hypothetical protein